MFSNVAMFVVGLVAIGVGIGLVSLPWALIVMGHYVLLLALINGLLSSLAAKRKKDTDERASGHPPRGV